MNKVRKILSKMSGILEKVIAGFLIVGIAVGCINLFIQTMDISLASYSGYIESILVTAFNMVMAIEFVRMLIKHSLNSIMEVLIYSFARSVAIGHMDAVMTVISIVSIVLLLLSRKFFFQEFDYREEE